MSITHERLMQESVKAMSLGRLAAEAIKLQMDLQRVLDEIYDRVGPPEDVGVVKGE